jgi:hypothetical protein
MPKHHRLPPREPPRHVDELIIPAKAGVMIALRKVE